jgi:hypothetical protein
VRAARFLSSGLAVMALALAGACGGPKDPIQALLAGIEKAAEHRSTAGVMEWLAPEFRAPSLASRADAESSLRRYFAAYKSVQLEIYEVEIERADAGATVRFRVDFNGEPLKLGAFAGLLPPSAMYRFELHVRPGNARWLVAGAEWEDLGPAGGQ